MIGDRKLNRDDFPFPLNRPLTGQDLLQLLPRLLQPIWTQAALAVRGDVAQVTAVNAGPPKTVSLTDSGETYTARYLATYTPVVGHQVLVLRNKEKAIVLGRLA